MNVANLDAAVEAAVSATSKRAPTSLFTLNLDHVVKLRQNSAFRKAYETASIVTADGAPVVWLGRSQATPLVRTTGADLVLPLAKAAAAHGFPIALFGTSPDVIAQAAEKLSAATGATITFTESPPMGFDPTSEDADAALDRMVASGSRIVLLALGAPKQEILAARAVERGLPITLVCIGAALDFIADAQSRAPQIFQSNGLEWLWRLANNPGRLFMRYTACAGVLADIAVVRPTIRALTGE